MTTDTVTVAEAVERLGLPLQSVTELALVGKLVIAPGTSSESSSEITTESLERYEHRLRLVRGEIDSEPIAPPRTHQQRQASTPHTVLYRAGVRRFVTAMR
jgi:hypothetical protein